jgi:hypothetical protein
MAFRKRRPRDPGFQFLHLLGKHVGSIGVRIESEGGQPVGPWSASHAEIDSPRRDRFEHSELLGNLERRVVRQHDARAADTNARRRRRDGRHQYLGGRSHNAVIVVMLRNPVAVVAERFAMPRERETVAIATSWARSFCRGRLIENRELQVRLYGGWTGGNGRRVALSGTIVASRREATLFEQPSAGAKRSFPSRDDRESMRQAS